MLDPIYFTRRGWMGHSGWPVPFETLRSHYERAKRVANFQEPCRGEPTDNYAKVVTYRIDRAKEHDFCRETSPGGMRCAGRADADRSIRRERLAPLSGIFRRGINGIDAGARTTGCRRSQPCNRQAALRHLFRSTGQLMRRTRLDRCVSPRMWWSASPPNRALRPGHISE